MNVNIVGEAERDRASRGTDLADLGLPSSPSTTKATMHATAVTVTTWAQK